MTTGAKDAYRPNDMDPQELRDKYYGDHARDYEAERAGTTSWARESDGVGRCLSRLDKGSRVLDVPVGTGRFISTYRELGLRATGLDASSDMLAEAARAAASARARVHLSEGSIFALPFDDASFDAVVCVRFLNWLDLEHVGSALKEMARVTRRYVITNVRTYEVLSPFAREELGRLVLQMKHRFYCWRTGHELVYAPTPRILAAFADAGLSVSEAHRISRSRRGLEHHVFLLEKP